MTSPLFEASWSGGAVGDSGPPHLRRSRNYGVSPESPRGLVRAGRHDRAGRGITIEVVLPLLS